MSFNTQLLQLEIYAAFRKLSVEQDADTPGGNKEAQLAGDLAAAIEQYICSGQVKVIWAGVGMGLAIAPWPGVVSVFSITAGTGLGFIK